MKTLQDLINELENNYIKGSHRAGEYVGCSHQAIIDWAKTSQLNPITIKLDKWYPIKELDHLKKQRT